MAHDPNNPFKQHEGQQEQSLNPFQPPLPSPANNPDSGKALLDGFSSFARDRFNVDMNSLSADNQQELDTVYNAFVANKSMSLSEVDRQAFAESLQTNAPDAASLLMLRDGKNAQTFEDLAAGNKLEGTRQSRQAERQRRVDEAAGRTGFFRDAASVAGSAAGGFLQGAGGILDFVEAAGDKVNPLNNDNFVVAITADGQVTSNTRKIRALREEAGIPPDTVKGAFDGESISFKTFRDLRSAAKERRKSGETAANVKNGFTLYNVDPGTLGSAIIRAGTGLSDLAKSEADKTIQREVRNAFDEDGAMAAAGLMLRNPLTSMGSMLAQSLGFVAGSAGLVGGAKAVGSKAAAEVFGAAAPAAVQTKAGIELFKKGDNILQGAKRLFTGSGRAIGRATVENAPTTIPVAIANAANTGVAVDDFFDGLTAEELQKIPAYHDMAASLGAAGKDNSPSSVRAALKSSAGATARATTFAGTALMTTFIPGSATIELAVVKGLRQAAGRASGKQAIASVARSAGDSLTKRQIAVRAAGVAAVEGVTEGADEAIQQGIETGVQDGTVDLANVDAGQIANAITSEDAQFGGLLGGILGAAAGGGIQTATDVSSSVATLRDTAPNPNSEMPTDANQGAEAVAILKGLKEQHAEVFSTLEVANKQKLEQAYGVTVDDNATTGVSLLHGINQPWVGAVVAKATNVTEDQANPVQGQPIPIYSSPTQAIMVDEGGNILRVTPDGVVAPITPDLNGTPEEQVAHVAVVDTKTNIDYMNDLQATINDAGDGQVQEAQDETDIISGARNRVSGLLAGPARAAIDRANKIGEDPAVPSVAPAAVIDILGSTEAAATTGSVQATVVAPVPQQTVAEVPAELAGLSTPDIIEQATQLSPVRGRAARRAAGQAAADGVANVSAVADTLIAKGLASAEDATNVAVSLPAAKDFPSPTEAPLDTIQRIEGAKAISGQLADARAQAARLDAIERGDAVDFNAQEEVNPSPISSFPDGLEGAPTFEDIARGEQIIPEPASIAPKTSRTTMEDALGRVLGDIGQSQQDSMFPAIGDPSAPLSVTAGAIIDKFNAKWPYPAKARLFKSSAEYQAALRADPSLDVIPVFNDRVLEGDARPNIVFGITQRYRLPELLGETGSLELLTRIRTGMSEKGSVFNRLSQEVRRDYKGSLSEDGIAAETLGRAIDGGFTEQQVADGVKFIRDAMSAHGAVDALAEISDVDLRSILQNSGSLWRAPTVGKSVNGVVVRVPDPGGIVDAINTLDGNLSEFQSVKAEYLRNPAQGQLAFNRLGATLRRTVGSVVRLRDVSAFVAETTGSNAFQDVQDIFTAGAGDISRLTFLDQARVIDPFNQERQAVQDRLGLNDAQMSTQFNAFMQALHGIERADFLDMQTAQLASGSVLTTDIVFNGTVIETTGTGAETARASIFNAVQANELDGSALSLVQNIVDEHRAAEPTPEGTAAREDLGKTVSKYAREKGKDGTNKYEAFTGLYNSHLKAVLDRDVDYRVLSGVMGPGHLNYLKGMDFKYYFPLTDEKGSGEVDPLIPQLSSDGYNSANKQRHAMKGRTSKSQHIFSAITENLDLARHELADQQLMSALLNFSSTEFAQQLPGRNRLRRTLGSDVLGIKIKPLPEGSSTAPKFEPGKVSDDGAYTAPAWASPPKGAENNEFTVWANGESQVMIVNDEETAEALRTRWPQGSSGIQANIEAGTRALASSFTSKNPTFWPKQLIRDLTFTPALIGTRFGIKVGVDTMLNTSKLLTPARMSVMVLYFNSNAQQRLNMEAKFGSDPLFKHFSEYVEAGGLTIFADQLQALGETDSSGDLGSRAAASPAGRALDRAANVGSLQSVLSGMDAVTNALENIPRLGAFAAMRESGMDVLPAAIAAKEIINFSQNSLQRGQDISRDVNTVAQGTQRGRNLRSWARSLYAFSGSGVTGTDVTLNTAIWKNGQRPVEFVDQGGGRFQPRNAAFAPGLAGTKALLKNLNYPMLGLYAAMGAMQVAVVGGLATAAGATAGAGAVVGGAAAIAGGRVGGVVGGAIGAATARTLGASDATLPAGIGGFAGTAVGAGAGLIGGAALVGAAATKFGFGDDDEEQPTLSKALSPRSWTGNWVLPSFDGGNSHILVPMQLGAAQLMNGMGALAALVANGDISYGEAVKESISLWETNATALPRHSQAERLDAAVVATLSPTVIRPMVSNLLNRSDFGTPIRADGRGSGYEGSAYTRAFGNTPEQYTKLSRELRETTGIDVAPETVRMFFKSYTGPIGNITDRLLRDTQRHQDGLSTDALTDGMLGAFVPNANSDRWFPNRRFWTARKRALRYTKQLNDRIKDDAVTGGATADALEKVRPGTRQLRVLVGRFDRQRSKLNKRKRVARRSPNLTDDQRKTELQAVDAEYRQLYLNAADQMDAITDTF